MMILIVINLLVPMDFSEEKCLGGLQGKLKVDVDIFEKSTLIAQLTDKMEDDFVQMGGLTLEPLVVDHESKGNRELVYKDGDYCLLQPLAMTEISSEDLMKLQDK